MKIRFLTLRTGPLILFSLWRSLIWLETGWWLWTQIFWSIFPDLHSSWVSVKMVLLGKQTDGTVPQCAGWNMKNNKEPSGGGLLKVIQSIHLCVLLEETGISYSAMNQVRFHPRIIFRSLLCLSLLWNCLTFLETWFIKKFFLFSFKFSCIEPMMFSFGEHKIKPK